LEELELAERLAKFATPTLYEVSPRVQALLPSTAPLYRPIQLWGKAYPVLTATGDNAAIHRAVAKAPEGSVLVVATGQDTTRGYWGEVLMEAALAKGIRGLIIDGGVRDANVLRERLFPVFCGAVAIPGTSKDRVGILNQPLMIAQALIRPGDFIVGDGDGVVVVQADVATEVLEAAEARVQKELRMIERIRLGESTLDLLNVKNEE
jgi:4-hydroxy-4-methyl-2-oxoglutarate aldolase